MSITSLTTLAVQRDIRDPKKPKTKKPDPDDASAEEPQSKLDVFTSVIPTELVGLYTALTAALVAAASLTNNYLPYRWGLFAAGCVGTPVLVALNYHFKRSEKRRRRFPGTELAAATIAFAVWGLVVPASPLIETLDDLKEFWILALTGVGGIAVGLFTPALTGKAPKAS
jgi:hypothetical protein